MKLNYRDRVILLIILSAVILIAGFVGLVKPRYGDIQDNKVKRDEVQAEWDGLDAKIQQIPTMQENVKKTKSDADKISEKFYSSADFQQLGDDPMGFMKTYMLDQFMQEYVNECNIKIVNMEVSDITDTTLDYYYYTPIVPATAILDLADLNGNYTKKISEKLAESNALSERTKENLFVQQYGISVDTTKDNLWKFMEKISSLDKSIIIDSVNIVDTDFGIDPATGKLRPDAEQIDGKGVTNATIVVSVYSAYKLDEPVLE